VGKGEEAARAGALLTTRLAEVIVGRRERERERERDSVCVRVFESESESVVLPNFLFLKNYFFQVEAKLRAVEAEEGGARVSRVAAMEAKDSIANLERKVCSHRGNYLNVLMTFTRKPRPKSGLDVLLCAIREEDGSARVSRVAAMEAKDSIANLERKVRLSS